MRRRLPAFVIAAGLAGQPACAHRQLTNQQVAVGAVIAVGVVGLIYLVVTQCHKGPGFCGDQSPSTP